MYVCDTTQLLDCSSATCNLNMNIIGGALVVVPYRALGESVLQLVICTGLVMSPHSARIRHLSQRQIPIPSL